AKIASDLDKPRGFAVIGRAEALAFLAPKPVGLIWGVGAALERRLNGDGITTIAELRAREERWLIARYGVIGRRLARFARGEDPRTVDPNPPVKSISVETTFAHDLADPRLLAQSLEPLCQRLAERMTRAHLAAAGIHLKLKTAQFRVLTRSRRLSSPTQRAAKLYEEVLLLLKEEAHGTSFRLIGIGADPLAEESEADLPDLFG
ncbi:MAG TPA: DNA polymerase IV, partial [Stellaceae bacterium]|nr:DNA polymerase IV [Stellaceae bacterium]